MIVLMFLAVGLGGDPVFTVAPSFTVKSNAFTVKPSSPPAKNVKKHVAGLHAHKCGQCGTIWEHGHDAFGNVSAHTCPRCGSGPYWIPLPATYQMSPMYRPIQSGSSRQSFCPI